MRTSVYVFTALAGLCAGVEWWGVQHSYFSWTQTVLVAICFAIAAVIAISRALEAYAQSRK